MVEFKDESTSAVEKLFRASVNEHFRMVLQGTWTRRDAENSLMSVFDAAVEQIEANAVQQACYDRC